MSLLRKEFLAAKRFYKYLNINIVIIKNNS